jgi:hypothetical protein
MTEQEARDFFEQLPVDERLRLVRDILGDIEGRISRARSELNGMGPQLELPELAADQAGTAGRRGQTLAGAASRCGPDEGAAAETDAADDWVDFELPDPAGARQHAVNRLRLADAAARYEKLLKHYGYIKGVPEPRQILRRENDAAQAGRKARRPPETEWAEWVARDAETQDRPRPHEWSDWVALGDDDPEA